MRFIETERLNRRSAVNPVVGGSWVRRTYGRKELLIETLVLWIRSRRADSIR
jgi:hypothetical protein